MSLYIIPSTTVTQINVQGYSPIPETIDSIDAIETSQKQDPHFDP